MFFAANQGCHSRTSRPALTAGSCSASAPGFLQRVDPEDEHAAQLAAVGEGPRDDELAALRHLADVGEVVGLELLELGRRSPASRPVLCGGRRPGRSSSRTRSARARRRPRRAASPSTAARTGRSECSCETFSFRARRYFARLGQPILAVDLDGRRSVGGARALVGAAALEARQLPGAADEAPASRSGSEGRPCSTPSGRRSARSTCLRSPSFRRGSRDPTRRRRARRSGWSTLPSLVVEPPIVIGLVQVQGIFPTARAWPASSPTSTTLRVRLAQCSVPEIFVPAPASRDDRRSRLDRGPRPGLSQQPARHQGSEQRQRKSLGSHRSSSLRTGEIVQARPARNRDGVENRARAC